MVRAARVERRGAATVEISGPTTVTLRNLATGRVAVLRAGGTSTTNRLTHRTTLSGSQLWLSADDVPFLVTSGDGNRHPRVIDPCALVGSSPAAAEPAATPAPWSLPTDALGAIGRAGLPPLIGPLIRHDHVHLDVLIDGRRVAVPAGIGLAEPVDDGPGRCPPPPLSRRIADCAAGDFFTGRVAASPLHTHTASGVIHIESDRAGTFTLGQVFDEWGVRFDSACIGSYCSGGGRQLRVYVNGNRILGDPRGLVLENGQEIAVILGGAAAFRSVPSKYRLELPQGCGGPGERACSGS